MTIDDHSNKNLSNPKFLAKPEGGRPFHKNPELLPLKSEKGFLLFIDFKLKSALRRENVSMKISGRDIAWETAWLPKEWAG